MPKSSSRQQHLKRAREWVYLQHFLSAMSLTVDEVIDGLDDGQEPDFTLRIGATLIGIELTTLAGLREQLGERGLGLRRWYWRYMAPLDPNQRLLHWFEPSKPRRPRVQAIEPVRIKQAIDKKRPKIVGYHRRRPLQQLWLLIHTDRDQPDVTLTLPQPIMRPSCGFQRIFVSRYPDRCITELSADGATTSPRFSA